MEQVALEQSCRVRSRFDTVHPLVRSALSVSAAILVLSSAACGGDDSAPDLGGGGTRLDAGEGGARADSGGHTSTPNNVPRACVEGTWDHDGNDLTACVAWTSCAAGTYVARPATTTADRTCFACPSGTFSTANNATSCVTWTNCAPGTYVRSPGTSVANRQCILCEAGTYSSGANQASCLPLEACAAGTEQTAPGTPASPPVCVACGAGTYCAGGTAPKQTCPSGTWDLDKNAATACVARTVCVAGQFVGADGSPTTDRSCVACPGESFSSTVNASSCTPWTTCTPGSFVSGAGSSIADRQCTACPEGETSTTTNATECVVTSGELDAGQLGDGSR